MAAIDELGYAPNFGARALAAKRTNTIGAVVPTLENTFFARGIQAFQEALVQHGLTLLIASSSYRDDLEADQIRTLVARGADALLLIGYHRSREIYDFLERRRVPVLVAWSYEKDAPQPTVGFNNAAAMASLTREIIRFGHRKLAVISAPTAANDRARCRVDGVRSAATIAGIEAASIPVLEIEYGIENGAQAFREILAGHPETTAVVCGSDVLGIGALRAAKEMGLSVPKDISITGFDDVELAAIPEPGLTTVSVPDRQMGRLAAESLIGMLDGAELSPKVELPTEIRFRASLGPPPN